MPGDADGAIDLHAHFLPPAYRAALAAAGHHDPDGFPLGFPAWTPEMALAAMDDVGIATAMLSVSSPGVLLGSDLAEAATLARQVNDDGAEIAAAYPGRFGLLASLPLPDTMAACAEAARALDHLGAAGVVLMTNYAGTYLGDPSLTPLFAELDQRAAVVVLHPTSPAGWECVSLGWPRPLIEFLFDTTRAVVNLALRGVLRQFPRIRYVIPHGGAALPLIADRVQRASATIDRYHGRPHEDVLEGLTGLYYDVAGGALPRMLPALLQFTGPGQLVYGSDFPFTPASAVTAFASDLRATDLLDPDELHALWRGNAEALFPGWQFGS